MGKKVKVYLNEGFQVTKETKIKHEKIPPPPPKPGTPVWVIILLVYAILFLLFSLSDRSIDPPIPAPEPLPVIPKRPPVPCPPAQQPFC